MSYFQKLKMMLMATAILGFAASSSLAATFDAAADFSITNNPNGVWQYGWSSSLGSDFNLLNATDTLCGIIDRYYEPTYYLPDKAHINQNLACIHISTKKPRNPSVNIAWLQLWFNS